MELEVEKTNLTRYVLLSLAPVLLCSVLGLWGHLCLCNQTDFTRSWPISSKNTQPMTLYFWKNLKRLVQTQHRKDLYTTDCVVLGWAAMQRKSASITDNVKVQAWQSTGRRCKLYRCNRERVNWTMSPSTLRFFSVPCNLDLLICSRIHERTIQIGDSTLEVYKNPFLSKVIIKVNLRIKIRRLNERQRSRRGFKVICGNPPICFPFVYSVFSAILCWARHSARLQGDNNQRV